MVKQKQTGSTGITGSERPIMVLLDLLSRKWALRILWELHLNGPCSFRTLQKHCGDISPTVVNSRLKELRQAGIITLRDREGYCITDQGLTLGAILYQLNDWAKAWGKQNTSAQPPKTKKKSPFKQK